jgi:S1-C subfamily serine protease
VPSADISRLHLPFVVLALAPAALLVARPGSAPAAQPPSSPVVDAIQQTLRATVMIEGNGVYGAGILVDPRRALVVTNYHVVQEMHEPRVTSFGGRGGTGRVVASDSRRDIALLSVPALRDAEATALVWGDAALLRPGQEVYAIGTPRKLPFTVSRGIVSYVGRQVEGGSYLQVDMNINDGNSGGPVISPSGDLVGIMSFIYRNSQGLSFALPITELRTAFPNVFGPTQREDAVVSARHEQHEQHDQH